MLVLYTATVAVSSNDIVKNTDCSFTVLVVYNKSEWLLSADHLLTLQCENVIACELHGVPFMESQKILTPYQHHNVMTS